MRRGWEQWLLINPLATQLIRGAVWGGGYASEVSETSCLNKSLVLKRFYGLEREKIIEYDFYAHIGNI